MRWPVQIQLLLPMLAIAVLAIGLASATNGYLGAAWTRDRQEENLRRVVTTLAEAAFPLTDAVLVQMSGLSGAEFVLLDEQGRIQASTLDAARRDSGALRQMPIEKTPGRVSARPFVELGGRQYLGQRVPVITRFPKTAQGSLAVLYEKERWQSGIRQAAYPALLAGISAVLAAMVLTAALARRLVRPVQQLGRETTRIAQGDFQPVAVPRRNDEIRDLALAINGMAEKLGQYERDVRSRERLRTLGQLGAGMAHQLRNSATGARMAIELHRRQCVQGVDDETLGVALRQLRLMESYLQRFLRIGRDHRLNLRDVALAEIVEEVLDLVRPTCVHGKIELEFRPPAERLVVHGDPDSLRDLVTNVVLNAIEAAKRPGESQPRVSVELEPLGTDRAVVRVKDSGAGPSAATRENLFEPLVSEKPEGAGLGLFVARQVAEAHHGSIAWQRLGDVTCFSIELPRIATGADDGTPAGG